MRNPSTLPPLPLPPFITSPPSPPPPFSLWTWSGIERWIIHALIHSSASRTSKQAILHADQVPLRLSRINYLMKTIRFLLPLPRSTLEHLLSHLLWDKTSPASMLKPKLHSFILAFLLRKCQCGCSPLLNKFHLDPLERCPAHRIWTPRFIP